MSLVSKLLKKAKFSCGNGFFFAIQKEKAVTPPDFSIKICVKWEFMKFSFRKLEKFIEINHVFSREGRG